MGASAVNRFNINEIILLLICKHRVFHMACLRQQKRAKELKTREKIQLTAVPPGRFTGALYHDDAPRDFGPQIAYACWRWFQVPFRYPVPDKEVRERKVGPYLSSTLLDFKLSFSHLFISQCSHRVFHVVHSEV